MRIAGSFIACVALLVAPHFCAAGDLSPADRAFFDKHIGDIVQMTPTRLDDAAVTKVFATPFFHVKLTIKSGDSTESQEMILARIGDQLVSFSGGHSDGELPDLVKMIDPKFQLKTDADAKTLQSALDVVYPILGDSDKKVEGFHQSGKQWTLVRGMFFNDKQGYVFTTDAKGAITGAKYVMKLP